MESDFRALLVGHAALIALVPAARIFHGNYAQGVAPPAIRFFKVSGLTGLHMQGSDGLTESRMQVDIRSAVRGGVAVVPEVLAIRDVLTALLHTFRGIQGSTDFRVIHLMDDRGVEFSKVDSTEYYTASLDFHIWSRAAA